MRFQILELHLLYLLDFEVELDSQPVYVFIMSGYLPQFFINARLDLTNKLLLISGILERKKKLL